MIDVCCAIILQDKLVLAVQHGIKSHHPGKWEFPGGKIKTGETAPACIVREIQEELAVEIEVLAELSSVGFDYGMKQVKLIPFVSKIQSGSLMLTEHANLQWFNLDNWAEFDWLEADRELIVKNLEQIKSFLK